MPGGLNTRFLKGDPAAAAGVVDILGVDENGNVAASGLSLLSSGTNLSLSAAATPTITLTDTTNNVSTILRSQDTVGTIGTITDHNFIIQRNSVTVASFTADRAMTFGTSSLAGDYTVRVLSLDADADLILNPKADGLVSFNSGQASVGNLQGFFVGSNADPTTNLTGAVNGVLSYNSSSGVLQGYLDGSFRTFLTGAGDGITYSGYEVSWGGAITSTVEIDSTDTNQAVNFGYNTQLSDFGAVADSIYFEAIQDGTEDAWIDMSTPGNINLYANGDPGTNNVSVDLGASGTGIEITLGGTWNVEYAADYSGNFTARSLVDKEYVDTFFSGGFNSTVSAATGNEVLFAFDGTVNKATSGNYSGIVLNVTETAAPGTDNLLLDLQVASTSFMSVGTTRGLVLPSNADPDTNYSSAVNGSVAYDSLGDEIRAYIGGSWTRLATIDDVSGGNPAPIRVEVNGSLSPGTLAAIPLGDNYSGAVISEVRISVSSLPGTQQIEVDIRKNGTATADSIFTSDTPLDIDTDESATNGLYQVGCDITGATVGTTSVTIDGAEDDVSPDDVLYIVLVQVGSGPAGSDLLVQVTF